MNWVFLTLGTYLYTENLKTAEYDILDNYMND